MNGIAGKISCRKFTRIHANFGVRRLVGAVPFPLLRSFVPSCSQMISFCCRKMRNIGFGFRYLHFGFRGSVALHFRMKQGQVST